MKTMTTAEIGHELAVSLKELRMPTVRACYGEQADLARRESLSYERYLLELLRREREERHHNRIRRWLRQSGLPLEKTLDDDEHIELWVPEVLGGCLVSVGNNTRGVVVQGVDPKKKDGQIKFKEKD